MSTSRTQYPQAEHRPRGRRTRKLIIVFGVLIVLLVGADFGAAAFAEHTVSQKAREQFDLTDDPAVTIHGFPFLTQAIGGDYSHLTVRAGGIPVQDQLRDVEISAELRDVNAPLSDITAGKVENVKIGKMEGQIRLKDSDIARIDPLTKIADLQIEPSTEDYVLKGENAEETDEPDEDSNDSKAGLRLSGKLQVAGQNVEVFAFAMIELDGTSVRIVPHRLQFGNDKETTIVPAEVQRALLPNFDARVNTGGLPFKVTPTAVTVEKGAVIIKGEATDATFTGATGY